MAKILRKTLILLIIACFFTQGAGISYALRPMTASNAISKPVLNNNFVFPAAFSGTEKARHAKIAQTIKTLFDELLIIADKSKSLCSQISQQLEMVIDLSNNPVTLHSGEVIKELKIYGNREWPTFYVPSKKSYVTINMNQHQEAYACYQGLFDLLKGNELEQNDDDAAGLPVKQDTEWDNWHNDNDSIPPDGYEVYEKVIDKYVTKYTLAAIKEISSFSSKKVINIFDLFGGTGRLFCAIDRSLRKTPDKYLPKTKEVKYFLVERNPRLVTIARYMLAHTNANIYKLDLLKCKDLEREMNEKADIVILEGAITRQVVGTKEDALHIIQEVNKVLSPGGFCIVTGYTGIWLKSTDFQKAGFDAINISIPHNTLNCAKISQLYILRKPCLIAKPAKNLPVTNVMKQLICTVISSAA